jgi:diguanylate cyclase (GGDEF)-like protein/PAS domain S-box-containing protein
VSSSAFDPLAGAVSGTDEAAGSAAEIVSASKGYRTAFDSAPIGIALVSPEGRWLQVNRALCQLVGYTEEQLLELNISDLTHPDDLAATLERKQRQVQGTHVENRIEKRYVRADGTTVWVAVTSTLVRDAAGAALYSVAQIENINDRVHAQAALGEAEERFRRAFNDAPIGMGLVAPDGRWLRVNERLTEITGFSEAHLLNSTFQDITHPDDVDIDVEHSRQLLAGEVRSYQMEKRYVRPDGQSIWVMLSVSLVRGIDNEPLYFISQVENINERKRVERELTRLAEHDSLTGLLNRRRFQQELERELKRARRAHGRAAILYIDIDHFKRVNDTHGHKAGDDVLQSIARRLVLRLRATDIIARLGGDEFAVLLLDLDSIEDARRIADEIRTAVRSEPVPVADTMVNVTISIGIATLGEGEGSDDQVLIAADNAMFEAKRSGRDGVSLALA